LRLDGHFIQGGLVIGKTEPGARVWRDGKAVQVSAAGHFLIGLGRDAAPSTRIDIRYTNGGTETRTMRVVRRKYEVQRIDGLPRRKVTPSKTDLARIRREKSLLAAARSARSAKPLFLSGFGWPARGRISGVYGSRRVLNGKPRRPHFGLDLAAPEGTPVHAPADGVVRFAHPDMFFNGKTIILDHGLGLTSAYLHLSTILVTEGQRIKKGEVIAKVGATGRATGAHLHWGVRLGATELDPALLVPPR
jgi:murein DD-endopeptidase MepM/ murein hydrolase activator NlpD